MTDMNYNNRRGCFNFGIGSYMNINGDLGYHILSTATDKFNVHLSHRSTNGNVKYLDSDEKVKAKLNDNLGGFDYARMSLPSCAGTSVVNLAATRVSTTMAAM